MEERQNNTKLFAIILGAVDIAVILLLAAALLISILFGTGHSGKETGERAEVTVSSEGYVSKGEDSFTITADGGVQELPETTGDSEYILPNSDSEYYSEADLENLTDWELKLARNEIYARHGRKFKDEQIAAYFESKSWYQPTYEPDEFDALGDSMLNACEIANLDLIREVESSR